MDDNMIRGWNEFVCEAKEGKVFHYVGRGPAMPSPIDTSYLDVENHSVPKSGVVLYLDPRDAKAVAGTDSRVFSYNIKPGILPSTGGSFEFDGMHQIIVPDGVWLDNIKSGGILQLNSGEGKRPNRPEDFEDRGEEPIMSEPNWTERLEAGQYEDPDYDKYDDDKYLNEADVIFEIWDRKY